MPKPPTSGLLPQLKLSANRRYLVTGNDRPFFWLGDTAWELFHRLDRDQARRYLTHRSEQGFTVILAVALAELFGLVAPNAYGRTPLIENDPTRPHEMDGDYDYWDHVDFIVNTAGELGMYIGFLPTWGDKWNKKWGVGPEIFTPANAEIYGHWIGRRYRETGNIIWILGGDRPIEQDLHRQITLAMARGLTEGDGGRYLKTFHPAGGQSSSMWFHDDEWLDFNLTQSGHDRTTTNYRAVSRDYSLPPAKPIIDGEPAYEYPVETNLPDDPEWQRRRIGEREVRRNAYWAVFSGAFGHVYGTHPVWQFQEEGRDPMWHAITPWHEALDLPGARQLHHLKALMLSRPFLSRIPDQSLIVVGQKNALGPMPATRDGTLGQNDATYLMIYLPNPRSVTIRTDCLPASTIRAWWFDPRTGKVECIGTQSNEPAMSFVPPTKSPDKDWVLVIDDASKNYPPPGNLPSALSSSQANSPS